MTARFPPPVLHLLHPREGGNSTLTSQGEVRAAHCMQGLGTLGARRGGPGQSRPLSWERAAGGARLVPHVATTAWKQEAGKAANRAQEQRVSLGE